MAERALGPNKETFLTEAYLNLRTATAARDQDAVLPSTAALAAGSVSLPKPGNSDWLHGRGAEQTLKHILGDIVPGLNRQALSSRYYGFVTGGVLPVAEAADNVVTALDQSLQFYLPGHSLSVAVEDAALAMLLSLLRLGRGEDWPGKTFTTGATASNICGLACGRDAVIAKRLPPHSCDTVPKVGLLAACAAAGVRRVQILTSMAHASLFKAASLVGLGHAAVRELPQSEHEPWRLDIVAVERELRLPDTASIIAVSAGEVNTGLFATGYGDGTALNDMASLRSLADRYDAWIHVDGGTFLAECLVSRKHWTETYSQRSVYLRALCLSYQSSPSSTNTLQA
jgi:glutamate/tyrosine decarboxylase-like PLP-dependent enzyme